MQWRLKFVMAGKPVHRAQQQYEGKDAMSLLDVNFKFKCLHDVEKSGLHWDHRFNQLQEIDVLKEDERTLIVSDSIEITEKSERWISESSPQLATKTVLFHGNLPQEKFAANFQAFVVDKTASIGCSTSKMTAGLNCNVAHVIIVQHGKARFLDNELNPAITNIGRTTRNKRKGPVTITFTHEETRENGDDSDDDEDDANTRFIVDCDLLERLGSTHTLNFHGAISPHVNDQQHDLENGESDDDASDLERSEKEPLRKRSKPTRVLKDASGGEDKRSWDV